VREILVYPRRINSPDITDALGSYLGDISAARFLIRDPIITMGIREYTGREPMREIHWMQSAKRGSLMIREFDYTRELSAAVIFPVDDIEAGETELLDLSCSYVRAVCETLVSQGVNVSFYTNGYLPAKMDKGVWNTEASAGRMRGLLEGLGRLTCFSKCKSAALITHAALKSGTDNAFIIVLPKNDTENGAALEKEIAGLRSYTGQEVLTLYVSPEENEGAVLT